MNILYILPKKDYFCAGWRGRVTHAIGVANGFARNGITTTILSGKGLQNFRSNIDKSIKLLEIRECQWSILLPGYLSWQVSTIGSCREYFKEGNYDIVSVRYAVGNILINLLFPRLIQPRTKLIIEINSLGYHQYFTLPCWLRIIIGKLEVRLISSYKNIYVVSEKIKFDLQKLGCKNTIIAIPNGAEPITVKNVNNNIPDSHDRLIYFGRFQNYYDFKILVDAFKHIFRKNIKLQLHFWGDGVLLKNVQRETGNHTQIFFHGQYDRNSLPQKLTSKDILVLPLRPNTMGSIGSPTKLFEYMSASLPIIAPSWGQVDRFIHDKTNGILYDPNNPESLIDAIDTIINDSAVRKLIAKNAYQDFCELHTWKSRMGQLIDKLND